MTVTKKLHLFRMPHNPSRLIRRHYGKTQISGVFRTHDKGHQRHGRIFHSKKPLLCAFFARTAKTL
jgi:hypothetical protein